MCQNYSNKAKHGDMIKLNTKSNLKSKRANLIVIRIKSCYNLKELFNLAFKVTTSNLFSSKRLLKEHRRNKKPRKEAVRCY